MPRYQPIGFAGFFEEGCSKRNRDAAKPIFSQVNERNAIRDFRNDWTGHQVTGTRSASQHVSCGYGFDNFVALMHCQTFRRDGVSQIDRLHGVIVETI
jgi:hypothetical protein